MQDNQSQKIASYHKNHKNVARIVSCDVSALLVAKNQSRDVVVVGDKTCTKQKNSLCTSKHYYLDIKKFFLKILFCFARDFIENALKQKVSFRKQNSAIFRCSKQIFLKEKNKD
jgi:hypothetical protein